MSEVKANHARIPTAIYKFRNKMCLLFKYKRKNAHR